MEGCELQLTSDLDNLLSWFHSNFLILNVSKTKIVPIGSHQRLSGADTFSVREDNTSLKIVDSFNISVYFWTKPYLGKII